MIGIKLEGLEKYLQLKRDTNISIRLENPIFGDPANLSPGSYSLPFDIPGGEASPENAAVLLNPDVIENAEAYAVKKASLEISEDENLIPFKKGDLKVRSTLGDSITANFNFGITSVSPEFKTAKLRDLLNENVVISSSAVNKKIYAKAKDSSSYHLEVNGKEYTGNYITIQASINLDADLLANTLEYVPFSYIEPTVASPGGLAAPYLVIQMAQIWNDFITPPNYSSDPFIPFAVKKMTESGDPLDAWQLEGDLGTYYDGFDTFIAGYINGSYPTSKIRFPLTFNLATFNTSWEGNKPQKWTEFVNAVDSGGLVKNDPNAAIFKNTNSLQPYVRLQYVLDKIAATYGLQFEGDFYTNTDIMERLLDNSELLDYPLEFVNGHQFLFWKRSFNIANLVPDISVVDFLKAIAARYNLAVYINEITGTLRMKFREPVIKSYNYEDVTRFASPISSTDDQRITGITLTVKRDESDALDLTDDTTSAGYPEEEIEIKCGHILNTRTYGLDGKVVEGPRVSRPAGDKFSLRLFQYTGLTNTGTFSYPSAAITGTSFVDRLAFGTLYQTYHRYWIIFLLKRKLIKLNLALPLRMLTRIDWELKRRYNRNNYLLKSLTLKVTNQGVEVTATELYNT